LVTLYRNRNRAAAVLASGEIAQLSMVVAIARILQPDDIPNTYEVDPWLIALQGASGSLRRPDRDFLAAFLLARALGQVSRSQAELLRYSYTQFYKAFDEHRFSSEAERLARLRLNWGIWFDWDSCSRLKETVTRRFIDNDLDPEIFGHLTDEDRLAVPLIDEAASTGRGRKYLRGVRKALNGTGGKGIKARADYIAERLK
ncbi:hypothetical protein, partial [Aurantimonas manganoxydans]